MIHGLGAALASLALAAGLAGAPSLPAPRAAAPAGPAAAPDAALEAPAEVKPEDYVYVASTSADRIGRVMAPVWVNGVGPFAFVVDTGASSSVLSPRLARRLALPPDPARTKLLRGITGSEVVPTVAVALLAAGEISLHDRSLPVVAPRVFADADGIFGADAFTQGCLYVNFDQSQVSILRKGCPRVGDTWERLRAELRFGGLPVVHGRVGRTRVLVIIDTGAAQSLGNRALLRAAGLEEASQDPRTLRQVYAATTQAVFGNLLPAPPVSLGGLDINDLYLVFGDFEVFRLWDAAEVPAIVLGMDLLGATQAMMIDYRRRELRLLPQGAPNTLRLRPNTTPTRITRMQ